MKILTLKNKLDFVPLKANCLFQCCSRDVLWGPKCWEPHNLTLCLHQNCHVSVTPAGWRCPRSTAASPYAVSVSVCTFEHVCRSQSAVFPFDVLMYFTISADACDHDVKLVWLHVSWLGGWVTCGGAGGRQVCVPDESRGKRLAADLSFGRKCVVLAAVCLCLAS